MTARDFRAHVIQLCDYVEDVDKCRTMGHPLLVDWATVVGKAKQLREFAFTKEE